MLKGTGQGIDAPRRRRWWSGGRGQTDVESEYVEVVVRARDDEVHLTRGAQETGEGRWACGSLVVVGKVMGGWGEFGGK